MGTAAVVSRAYGTRIALLRGRKAAARHVFTSGGSTS